jgi:hypothetical protein
VNRRTGNPLACFFEIQKARMAIKLAPVVSPLVFFVLSSTQHQPKYPVNGRHDSILELKPQVAVNCNFCKENRKQVADLVFTMLITHLGQLQFLSLQLRRELSRALQQD